MQELNVLVSFLPFDDLDMNLINFSKSFSCIYTDGSRYSTYIIRVIDWVVFLVLGILALVSVEESLAAYSEGRTSWAIENHPIQSQPTLSVCFALSHVLQSYWYWYYGFTLGKDFNISVTTSSKR